MSPLCAAPLLQPDHEAALRRVAADCLYTLMTRFPHSIRLERITDDGFIFSTPDIAGADATAHSIEAATARATLATIGHAAGMDQQLVDSIINTLPQASTAIFITPYI